jgi:hypothetical protein
LEKIMQDGDEQAQFARREANKGVCIGSTMLFLGAAMCLIGLSPNDEPVAAASLMLLGAACIYAGYQMIADALRGRDRVLADIEKGIVPKYFDGRGRGPDDEGKGRSMCLTQ